MKDITSTYISYTKINSEGNVLWDIEYCSGCQEIADRSPIFLDRTHKEEFLYNILTTETKCFGAPI